MPRDLVEPFMPVREDAINWAAPTTIVHVRPGETYTYTIHFNPPLTVARSYQVPPDRRIMDRVKKEPGEKPDMRKPNYRAIQYLLRRPHLWDDILQWNFTRRLDSMRGDRWCGCAMGLSILTWGESRWRDFEAGEIADGTRSTRYHDCFCAGSSISFAPTPIDVANRIDLYHP